MRLPECVRIDVDDDASQLESEGWKEIEVLETWAREPVTCEFEPCGAPVSGEQIHSIALRTGGNSRLYKDPSVSNEDADDMRLFAICNSDHIIAQDGGFLTWSEQGKEARIGVIAVDPSLQGEGIGSNLLRAWLTMMVGKRTVIAGTQSDNPAGGFYKSHGFKIVKRERTFHK